MKQDEEWMRLALTEAEAAGNHGDVPVGAVLVKDGQVIASAHNRREEHNDPTAHAELLCIREGAKALDNWRLNECTLYVTLEPCPMCAGAILMSRVKRCVWGAADPEAGCCGSVYDLPGDAALHGTTRWTGGVLVNECQDILTRFFEEKRTSKEDIAHGSK